MSLKEEMKEILGLKKMQKIAVERLHPPMAPKIIKDAWDKYDAPASGEITIVSETSVEKAEQKKEKSAHTEVPQGRTLTDSTLAIDFSYLANNSSFQRAIMEFIKKFVPGFENVEHRGSKKVMRNSFDQSAQNYREVHGRVKIKTTRKEGRMMIIIICCSIIIILNLIMIYFHIKDIRRMNKEIIELEKEIERIKELEGFLKR